MILIEKNSFAKLEFQELLNRISPVSPYGKKLLSELTPYFKGQEEALSHEFKRLEEIQHFIREKKEFVEELQQHLSHIKNITPLLQNCLKNHIVDEVDCFEIKELTFFIGEIHKKIADIPVFHDFFLSPLTKVEEILDPNDEKTLSFHFYNRYSPKLEEIRKQKREIENRIFLEKDELKKQGLFQQRVAILAQEEEEEYLVRGSITKQLRPFIPAILENIDKIGQLDLSLAKIQFFQQHRCVKPEISAAPLIECTHAVNIRVKEFLEAQHQRYTPIDIHVTSGSTVITGANMGGKSVALRTIAESVLLFHYGLFVPCEKATISLFEFIYFISDDMQDFSKGISSFGGEIFKLKELYPFLKKQKCGLIIFDEFARGTNPQEGQKFVKALVSYLQRFPAISIITSHFDHVITPETVHYQVVGLKNVDIRQLEKKFQAGHISISMIQEYMDYRLERTNNIQIPHDAFHVAALIGLDPELKKIIQQEYNTRGEIYEL